MHQWGKSTTLLGTTPSFHKNCLFFSSTRMSLTHVDHSGKACLFPRNLQMIWIKWACLGERREMESNTSHVAPVLDTTMPRNFQLSIRLDKGSTSTIVDTPSPRCILPSFLVSNSIQPPCEAPPRPFCRHWCMLNCLNLRLST